MQPTYSRGALIHWSMTYQGPHLSLLSPPPSLPSSSLQLPIAPQVGMGPVPTSPLCIGILSGLSLGSLVHAATTL